MKPYEIIKDIYIVGGPDITDGRDGCIYLDKFRRIDIDRYWGRVER